MSASDSVPPPGTSTQEPAAPQSVTDDTWWEELIPGNAKVRPRQPRTDDNASGSAAHPEPRRSSQPPPNTTGQRGWIRPTIEPTSVKRFVPKSPRTLGEAGLNVHDGQTLLLKYLLNHGVSFGRDVAFQLKMPYNVVAELLKELKQEKMIVYRDSTHHGDYEYELTTLGMDRARRASQISSYYGAAPVPLSDYIASVEAQRVDHQGVGIADLRRAFRGLDLSEALLSQLGQAIHSGVGLFLFGPPGNGKTSVATRVTDAIGDSIWIPRAINAYGEIIRLFDPNRHVALDETDQESDGIDARWIRIRRPTVVAGGDLSMADLEIHFCPEIGISEAPLQLKSNCGTLVIDDFGRQQMHTSQLLNRWIVPLEERHDYLNLTSGRKIQVPFEQLIVFSTNLEPRDLVEEAFLRRIPYKVEVHSPTVDQFYTLFHKTAQEWGIGCTTDDIRYLMDRHYRDAERELRFCHARDLLRQVKHYCGFHRLPLQLDETIIDAAVHNYFSIL